MAATYFSTYRCNLRCPHCSVPDRQGEELDPDGAAELIASLARTGLMRIGISGGEPLMRQDIGRLVRSAVDRNLFASVFTNGLLVRDRFDEIRPAHMIMTSIDGPAAVHDEGRGAGSHARTLDAIEFLRSRGRPVLGSTVVTRRNIDHLKDVLDDARRLGIWMILHPIHRYFADPAQKDDQTAETERIREAFRCLLREKRAGAPILNSVPHLKYVIDRYPDGHRTCYAGSLHVAVLPDGTIVACPHITRGGRLSVNGSRPAIPADLPRPDCRDCFCYPVVGQDFLFSARPGELLNFLTAARRAV